MRAATHAAHANGMHVAAHCHAVESIVRAMESGVDTIVHASFTGPGGTPQFDVEIAARIKGNGLVVGPTAISGMRIAQAIRAAGGNGSSHNTIARLSGREHDRGNRLRGYQYAFRFAARRTGRIRSGGTYARGCSTVRDLGQRPVFGAVFSAG